MSRGGFYFLEMNTRLEVEHPVTEVTTGTDLVALHLNVADGGTLDEHPPSTAGHAIEVRLYAEEPAENYQPQSGTLHRFAVPGVATEFKLPPGFDVGGSSGIRLDSGVEDASVVGTHYDPMLAKLIAWAPTRTETTRRLAAALRNAAIHGVRTDRALLVRILDHPAFQAGDTDTAFLDRHELPALSVPLADEEATSLSALAGALALAADNQRAATVLAGLPSGWRNVVSQPQHKSFHLLDRTVAGTAEPDRHDRRIDVFCRVAGWTASRRLRCRGTRLDGSRSGGAANRRRAAPLRGRHLRGCCDRRAPRVRRLPARTRCAGDGQPVPQRTTRALRGRCWRPCRVRSCASRSPRTTRSSPGSR